MVQLSSFNELIKKTKQIMQKEIWKKIPGKLVNPRWEVANI